MLAKIIPWLFIFAIFVLGFMMGRLAEKVMNRNRFILTRSQSRSLLSVLFQYGFRLEDDQGDWFTVGQRVQEAVQYVKEHPP